MLEKEHGAKFLGCLGMWLWFLFKMLFTQKIMSIIFFLKLFLRSAHQNNLKTSKTYYFKAKKKIQIFSETILKSTPKFERVFCSR
jgi:hypothetical protein